MARNAGAEFFIGTSGYSYPDWKGVVYPRSIKRDVGGTTPELTYLSRYFNTCEINATFYRQFEPQIAAKWSDAVENPDFRVRDQSQSSLHPRCRHKARRTQSADFRRESEVYANRYRRKPPFS
jgi:hypothetical protein